MILLFTGAAAGSCLAQDTTENKPLTFSGYAEVYYTYDFNRPGDHTRPAFLYSHNRTGEINLNLGYLKAAYGSSRVRGNLALAAGTYMNANYAAEEGVLKNIYEANIGVKLSGKRKLWIDAGILPSHIGFESAVGKDNWTLTRGLAAENSPYFETGLRLGYTTLNGKWYLAALYLNGWQRIQRPEENNTPAFGAEVTFRPSEKVTLNYSGFSGSDQPDSLRKMRYFNNLYGIFQISDRFGITAGIDFGLEQQEKGSGDLHTWYAPVLIFRYSPSSRIHIAVRGEYYRDKNGVILATGMTHGAALTGVSANVDYAITSHVVWRTEARNLSSKDAIFIKKDGSVAGHTTAATTALAIFF
ncbi:porin [Compostibacter hankyongensis]|uniref:Porin n=2 Tax=Compostibacter hankyongensis TaxID=1007089 RepID=A0ABP8FMU3_9BACT